MLKVKSLRKLTIILLWSAFFVNASAQDETASARAAIEAHRKKQESEMKSDKSPLLPKDKKKFRHLNYYPIDPSYRVQARFVKTENPVLFKMKTTTTRLPDYVKYGEVTFLLQGKEYTLEVYQSPDIIKMEGYADYLFIPFTDETNGDETYEVGRYLEMRVPEGDEVIIDFNLCYSPYCSYNPKYSCPIPPQANDLPIAIKAGEKKFKKH